MTNEPTITKNNRISPVWTLPIIALTICGWLLWSSFQNSGVDITIIFEDASGIVPGKTRVMAKGIPVGLVKKVIPDLEAKNIKAIVEMEQEVTPFLVEDTVFWIVRPELSASSVQGLDTILSGSYIGVQVGASSEPRIVFTGLNSAPPISKETPGLHLQLLAEALGSIQVGTGIYYRNIKIGTVQTYQLIEDENVLIDLFIEPDFTHLVREGSRFCNASGLQISGKLTKLKVQVESLASLLRGGILLHTPEQLQETPQAKNNHIFPLYPDYESANYGISMTLTLTSGDDIIEGDTKVMYRGLEAGFVKEIQINNDEKRSVTALIMLDPRAELILRENTNFWLVKPEISPAGINNLRLLLAGTHITFQPGDGNFQDHFEILPEPPPQIPLRKGRTFTLTSTQPANISGNSLVYYQNIPVGEVIHTDLTQAGDSVQTRFFVYEKYINLLSEKSIFWIDSGIQVEAGFDKGLTISTGPLAQMLQGGINFTTPGKKLDREQKIPNNGFNFKLYDSYDNAIESNPLLQPVGKKIQIIAEDAKSLTIGGPILHKNIKIGEIVDYHFTQDQQKILLSCFIYEDYQDLVHENSRFFNVSGVQLSASLSNIKLQTGSLQSLLAGGIGCVNVKPGNGTVSQTPYHLYPDFQAATHADEIELTFYLKEPFGIKIGSPIHHKGIKIGEINTISFSEDLKTIVCTAKIDTSMQPLFTTNTIVWVAQAAINLSGVKNIETLVFGSYLHFLPGKGKPARTFKVLAEPPRTKIASQDGLGIILETSHLGSINSGSPVYYRQVQIGEVTDVELSATFQKVYIYVAIKDKYSAIIRENTKFWNVSGARIEGGIFSGLSISTESLEAIIRGGIALATPNTETTGAAVPDSFHFTLHDKVKDEWIDWSPNVILLDREQPQEFYRETK